MAADRGSASIFLFRNHPCNCGHWLYRLNGLSVVDLPKNDKRFEFHVVIAFSSWVHFSEPVDDTKRCAVLHLRPCQRPNGGVAFFGYSHTNSTRVGCGIAGRNCVCVGVVAACKLPQP